MFLDRLKETLWYVITTILFLATFIGGTISIENFPAVGNVIAWVVFVIVATLLVFALCVFVNWLIVEPFKVWRKENADGE